ncbi:MAG: hypothetical protein Q9218_008188, partial [Villophora microphyllina]
ANQISTAFLADLTSYMDSISTASDFSSLYSVLATGMPGSAMSENAANPPLYLASLAQATGDDRPDWFTSLPTAEQDYLSSMGNGIIELYTSEVNAARPLDPSFSRSLSSVSASLSSATESIAAVTSSLAAAAGDGVRKGGAPASPVTSGHMAVVAGGVAIAAGLFGLVLL